MTLWVDSEDDGPPVTTLTGVVADQATLHGLLRRPYALSLPLMSVRWVIPEEKEQVLDCYQEKTR